MTEQRINFCGTIYTMEKLAEEYCEGNLQTAEAIAEKLVNQGRATWVDASQHKKEDKQLLKALVQETIVEQANLYDAYDEQSKQFNRNQSREGRLTYKGIRLDFPHLAKAQEFQNYVVNNFGLETRIVIENNKCVLEVFNLTDKELNGINRVYKSDNAIQAVVGGVDKAASGATKAVDYAAKKVVAPTVQVGAKAGVSILKTLAVTGAKATGTVVTALAFGTKQCVQEISTDPDVVRATRELLEVKDGAMRGVKGLSGNRASGISIIE